MHLFKKIFFSILLITSAPKIHTFVLSTADFGIPASLAQTEIYWRDGFKKENALWANAGFFDCKTFTNITTAISDYRIGIRFQINTFLLATILGYIAYKKGYFAKIKDYFKKDNDDDQL